eukprot:CAMPEP_0119171928 /NCGR_PEP_ID=MMETSP1315-20130426/26744_1 /TAXON_ID=676789 /ORGANISM="Prasinoderma singularis, Strain RCC927" /LENGTH=38 /DNA_ID= /DNA_START= /DNA_END= /DNA_ORIENTATION=
MVQLEIDKTHQAAVELQERQHDAVVHVVRQHLCQRMRH